MTFTLKKQRLTRSELRLGKRAISYETVAFHAPFLLTRTLKFLQMYRTKLVGSLVLAMLFWAIYLLFTTPMFFIYGAEIQGNVAVSAREIYAVSKIDSQSVFWVDPTQVAQRIKSLPNIKSATVSIRLPANVMIEVTERRPELLWQTGEKLWWVDSEGTIVPPKGDTKGMLRIIDDDQLAFEAGYQIDPTIIQGVQTLQILVPGLTVIHHSRARGLTVATPEGWTVYLGDGSKVKQKLVSLTAVLTYLKNHKIKPTYIDVANPFRPIYRETPLIPIEQPRQPRQPQQVLAHPQFASRWPIVP